MSDIKIDEKSKYFISIIFNRYKQKIFELCYYKDRFLKDINTNVEWEPKIVDIIYYVKKITPSNIIPDIPFILNNLKNKYLSVINNKILLNKIVKYIKRDLIKFIWHCVEKFNLDIIYPSCVIFSISNNDDYKNLLKTIGIIMPDIKNTYKEKSKEELLQILSHDFKGLDNFDRNSLLLFIQPITDDNNLIQFYNNYYSIKGENSYYKNIIMDWDDYKLETDIEYMNWLFPEKLSETQLKEFRTNILIHENVARGVLRIMYFFGFIISNGNIKQVKKLNRVYKGQTIGIYSSNNYKRITQILKFLKQINMKYLLNIFFLMVCKAIKTDKFLHEQVKKQFLKEWVKILSFKKDYKVYGLNYTGNSCYMDSLLLCLLVIPNKVIKKNILQKNLDSLRDEKVLFKTCNSNLDKDILIRKNIQKELNNITESIRGINKVENCSTIRSLIKKCDSNTFYKPIPQDAGEFLFFLFNMFQVSVSNTIRKTYGSNNTSIDKQILWEKITEIKDIASPIVDIVATKLLEIKEKYNLKKFLKQTSDSVFDKYNKWTPDKQYPEINFMRRKELYKIISSPIIIFNLNRTYGKPIYNEKGDFLKIKTKNIWKQITIPKNIILDSKKLYLTSIVVHNGNGHYIANYKHKGEWYWYNDIGTSEGGQNIKHAIKHIGSYQNMLLTTPSPETNGTIFFYM